MTGPPAKRCCEWETLSPTNHRRLESAMRNQTAQGVGGRRSLGKMAYGAATPMHPEHDS